MRQTALSVLIPTRHEAKTIGPFIGRLQDALGAIPAEVIVVDDSDHDDTPQVLHRMAENLAGRLIVCHRPAGSVSDRTLGTAIVEGIRLARGTYVCVLDGDGQHPPEAINAMLSAAHHKDADYVCASRYLPGGSAEGLNGTLRRAISLAFAVLTRLLFCLTPIRTLTDPLSGFFLFRREAVSDVVLRPIGWKISVEVLVRSGVRRVTEVPYTFARRTDDQSKATFGQGLLVLRHLVTLLLSLQGVRRGVAFAAVGVSGMCINTGALLIMASAGWNVLTWPIWLATEIAIVWNYNLNRHITWRERPIGRWWVYNLVALSSSTLAIAATTLLAGSLLVPLWLASVAGIGLGMIFNYSGFDYLVFSKMGWIEGRTDLKVLGRP